MTEPLHLDRFEIATFGGLSDRRIDLPDHSLVVVHGANEAGKSTLAEFISWLLVGPHGDAANARRFGDPEAQVGGVLSGSLGGQRFESEGTFKIRVRGAPNDMRQVRVHADGSYGPDQWRARLGGVDAEVFQAIYRMWGEQLHTGDGVDDQLSRVALGALSGQVDARGVIAALNERFRTITDSRKQGVESIVTINRSVSEIDQRLAAAKTNADEYNRYVTERAQLDTRRAVLGGRLQELATERERLAAAVEVFDRRARAREIDRDLAELETVPETWSLAVRDLDGLRAAVQKLKTASDDGSGAERAVVEAAGVVGLDPQRLGEVVLSEGQRTTISQLAVKFEAVSARIQQGRNDLIIAEAAEVDAANALQSACAQLPGAPDPSVIAAAERIGDDLPGAIREWDRVGKEVDTARSQHELRRRDVSIATTELGRANAAWDRLGLGVTAQAWQAQRSAGVVATRSPIWVSVGVAGLAVLAAVLAAVSQQYLVAVLVAVAGVIAAWSTRPRATAASSDSDAVREAAETVIEFQRALDTAEREAEVSARSVAQQSARAAEVADEVARTAARYRVVISTDSPAEATADLERWRRATETRTVWVSASANCEQLRSAADDADREAADLLVRAAEVIEHSRLGAVSLQPIEPVMFLARLDGYLAVVAAQRSLEMADETRRDALDTLMRFGPSADEIDTDLDALVDRGHRYAAIAEQRAALVLERDDIERHLARVVDTHAGIEVILDGAESKAALEVRLAQADEDVAQIEAERAEVTEQIGACGQRLDELTQVDQLADLALERTTLSEFIDDLIIDAIVTGIAEGLVTRVMAEYEDQHQPALIAATSALVKQVSPDWESVIMRESDGGKRHLQVRRSSGSPLAAQRLSTGARALLYLAVRLAMADHDAESRKVLIPLICDDPIVHLDDDRANRAMATLAGAARSGRQVVILTCHGRTVDAGRAHGAAVVEI